MIKEGFHKDRECLHCIHFVGCEGKPKEVKLCIKYEERKKANGRKKNVCKNNN